MHKTLPTLGNKKEQQQNKFYKKSSGEFIFLWATKSLKMFYFTCPTGQVLKNTAPSTLSKLKDEPTDLHRILQKFIFY